MGLPTRPSDSDSRRNLYIWLVAATMLAGTIVRLGMYISATPQYDESFTHLNFATVPLWDAASSYFTPGNHILYSILANISQMALDGDILVTRLPALLAGILVIPALIYFAHQVTASRRVALIAGLLAAFHPQLILYSAEARGYTMLALFAVIWVIVGYRFATSDSLSKGTLIQLSVVSALGAWSIPVFVYALVALVAWMVVLRAMIKGLTWQFVKTSIFAGLLTGFLTFLAYLPAISREGLGNIVNNPYLTTTSPRLGGVPGRAFSSFFELLPGYLGSVTLWMAEAIPTVFSVLLAALVVLGVASHRSPIAIRVLVPVFIPVFVLALALHRLQPLARSWAPLLPLLLVTAAAGAGAIRTVRTIQPTPLALGTLALVMAVATGGLVATSANYDSHMRDVAAADMEQVVNLMAERFPDGATLVVHRSAVWQSQYWYSRRPDLEIGGDTRVVAIDHRLDGSLDDLAEMRHLMEFMGEEPARRVGVSKENLVPIAEFGSTTVYWNGA